jgi:hypothetical protein
VRIGQIGILVLAAGVASGNPGPGAHDCLDLASYPQVTGWLDVAGPVGVLAHGRYVYVSADRFYVVDFGGAATPKIVASLELEGYPGEIVRDGNVLYVATRDPDVTVLDVADPTQPVVLAVAVLDGLTRHLELEHGRLYLLSQDRLRVLDVQDPAHPVYIGLRALPCASAGFDVQNDVAYIGTTGDVGLIMMDVSDPHYMRIRTYLDTPSFAWDVAAAGNRLYVADDRAGLVVYDITQPYAPTYLGAHPVEGEGCGRVEVAGDGLVVAGSDDGLQIFDVADPRCPKLAGRLPGARAWGQLAVAGSQLMVATPYFGVAIADIAHLGVQPLTELSSRRGFYPARMLQVDDRLLVAGRPTVWSLPTTPGPASSPTCLFDAGEFGRNLHRDGNLLYVAAGEAGVYVLDIAEPAATRVLGHHDLGITAAAWDVQAVGDLLFVAVTYHGHGLTILDVGDPAHIVEVGHLALPWNCYDVEVVGDRAYVAGESLWVVDIQDVATPTLLRELLAGSVLTTLARDGDVLYASSYGSDGIYSIGIADPTDPQVRGQLTTPSGGDGQIAIVGATLYAARNEAGVQVLDITDPSHLRHRGFLDTPYQSWGAAAVVATADAVITGNREGIVARRAAPCGDSGGVFSTVAEVPRLDLTPDLSLTVGPNPANPRVEIELVLAQDQAVRVAVFDAAGRRVADLFGGSLRSGRHRLAWDGLDRRGQAAPSGTYLVRVLGERTSRTAKVSLVR